MMPFSPMKLPTRQSLFKMPNAYSRKTQSLVEVTVHYRGFPPLHQPSAVPYYNGERLSF